MVPSREKVDKGAARPGYPSLRELDTARRAFLKRLGGGALAVTASFAGVSCMGISTEHARDPEPDVWTTMGVAPPMDVVEPTDVGEGAPDVQEPDFWTTGGVPAEDIQVPPPDLPALPGEMPMPD